MIKTLEELKIQFVVSVYETITRQIQHTDIKTSILISWNGVMAVMLGREVVSIFSGRKPALGLTAIAVLVAAGLVLTGISIYGILRPRSPKFEAGDAAAAPGLLYAGDILKLGRNPSERMKSYLTTLLAMDDAGDVYAHYVKSIVLIADIMRGKNRKFLHALLLSTITFCLLATLIAASGISLGGI